MVQCQERIWLHQTRWRYWRHFCSSNWNSRRGISKPFRRRTSRIQFNSRWTRSTQGNRRHRTKWWICESNKFSIFFYFHSFIWKKNILGKFLILFSQISFDFSFHTQKEKKWQEKFFKLFGRKILETKHGGIWIEVLCFHGQQNTYIRQDVDT